MSNERIETVEPTELNAPAERETSPHPNSDRSEADRTVSRLLSLLVARAHRLRFFFVALLITSVFATTARTEEVSWAVRGEGYLGYSRVDLLREAEGLTGGGAASAALRLGELYLQGDVFGDVLDYDDVGDVSNVGPGLHFGWRDAERGSAGVVATYNRLDLGAGERDGYRAGVETELYFDRATLGLNGGYLGLGDDGGLYLELLGLFYPTERVRLQARAGAQDVDVEVSFVHFGAGAEFLLTDHVAPFVRFESAVQRDFDRLFQTTAVAGLTVYWGGDTPSLQAYDRQYFKPSCAGIQRLGRYC